MAAGVRVHVRAGSPVSSRRVSVLRWLGRCIFAISFEVEKCGFSNFTPVRDCFAYPGGLAAPRELEDAPSQGRQPETDRDRKVRGS